jgi:hypothetical protein
MSQFLKTRKPVLEPVPVTEKLGEKNEIESPVDSDSSSDVDFKEGGYGWYSFLLTHESLSPNILFSGSSSPPSCSLMRILGLVDIHYHGQCLTQISLY